jgi:hypothetical protein
MIARCKFFLLIWGLGELNFDFSYLITLKEYGVSSYTIFTAGRSIPISPRLRRVGFQDLNDIRVFMLFPHSLISLGIIVCMK